MDDFIAAIVPQRNRNGQGLVWNQDDDQQLASLWPHNSAGVIARIMVPPRTRNAIIGRAHRIGLAMKIKKSKGNRTNPRKPRVRKKPSLTTGGLCIRPLQPKPEIAIEPQNWTPIGIPMLEAERQHCRAVIEPPATAEPGRAIVCGHHVTHPVFSFCPYHLELYTESPHNRRRSHWKHWKRARR